jgi:hypothetical protein
MVSMGFFSRMFSTQMPPQEVGRNLGGVFLGDQKEMHQFLDLIDDSDEDAQRRLIMELHYLRAFVIDFGVYQVLGHGPKKKAIMDSFMVEMCEIASELANTFDFQQFEFVGDLDTHLMKYGMMANQLTLERDRAMVESGIILKTFLELAKAQIPYGANREMLQMFVFQQYFVGLTSVMEFVKAKA